VIPLVFTSAARADMKRLDPQIAARVEAALDRYSASGYGGLTRLKGDPPEFRLRVGDWRVRFKLPGDGAAHVVYVRHRSEVYK
jgi:mRNA-degrading endonuclease RelE of RelBE toxin-antitoxin system